VSELAPRPQPPGPVVVLEPAGDGAEAARQLASSLGLALVREPGGCYALRFRDGRLELLAPHPDMGPLSVDFLNGEMAHRLRQAAHADEGLARAVGARGDPGPRVIDATGGLGRDAAVLARRGCRVTILEREPVIAALLEDGLHRGRGGMGTVAEGLHRIRLVENDARAYLASCAETEGPDVIYLDPMYPERRKSALVRKEMRIFRAIAGDDRDAEELLAAALVAARQRVVVKRPTRAPSLGGPAPSGAVRRGHTRFDIYAGACLSG